MELIKSMNVTKVIIQNEYFKAELNVEKLDEGIIEKANDAIKMVEEVGKIYPNCDVVFVMVDKEGKEFKMCIPFGDFLRIDMFED